MKHASSSLLVSTRSFRGPCRVNGGGLVSAVQRTSFISASSAAMTFGR